MSVCRGTLRNRAEFHPLFRRHAIFKFTLVRIGVARGACAVRKMERHNFVGSSAEACLVAFHAGNGHVRPGQHEMSLLVLGNRKGGAMKVFYRVAILTTILVGSGGKLFVVFILMAIRARREFHFVLCIFSGRRVAFVAGNGCMLSISGYFDVACSFTPNSDGFHASTVWHSEHSPLLDARLELPLVRIDRVAIHALCKSQLLFEISA